MAEVNDRLVVELSVNIDQLNSRLDKAVASFSKANNAMARSAQEAAKKTEEAFGKMDIEKALNGTFGKINTGVMEAGAEQAGIFGVALEHLGAVGLVAAGGLAAAGLAMEQAAKASEFAEMVENTAKILGITTDRLQEYLFAFQSIGVAPEQAIEALKKLNEALGAFQSGVGNERLKKVFDFLELTPQQRASLKTVDDFLPLLADKVKDLAAPEAARVLSRLGLEELAPLLQKGAEGFKELGVEAEKSGDVMSAQALKAAAELNSELNQMHATIDGNLRNAFVSLGPVLTAVTGTIMELAKGFRAAAGAVADFFGQSNAKKFSGDFIDLNEAEARLRALEAGRGPDASRGGTGPNIGRPIRSQQDRIAQISATIAEIATLRGRIETEAPHADAEGGAAPVIKPPVPKTPRAKKEKDDTESRSEEAAKALDTGTKDYLSAQTGLTQNIRQHAAEEKAAIDAETVVKGAELQRQLDAINDDKTLDAATKQKLTAEIQLARMGEQQAAVAKKALVDRDAEEKLLEARRSVEAQVSDYAVQLLNDAKSMASTSAERRTLALAALAIEQEREQQNLADQQRKGFAAGTLNRDQADAQTNGLLALQLSQTNKTVRDNAGPGQSFANQLGGASIGDELQTAGVQGIQKFGDALDQLVLKTGKAREVWHAFALSVVQDLLKIGMQKMVEAPLASAMFGGGGKTNVGGTAAQGAAMAGLTAGATSAALALNALAASASLGGAGGGGAPGGGGGLASMIAMLPHFAGGTDFAGGGPSIVGDGGEPEIVNLPRGSSVTPLSQAQSMGAPASRNTTTHLNIATSIDLTGANGDDTIRQIAYQAASEGSARAVQIAREVIPNDLNRRSGQSLTGAKR